MSKVDLSIIVLVYNAEGYIKDCVKSIEKSKTSFSYEIIVVDNLSTDNSRSVIEQVADNYKNIKPVLSNENLGFTKGNNLGVRHSTGRFVLFLNPDTVLSPNALQICYDYLKENPDVGVVGGNLKLANGEPDSAAHRGFPTPWNSICQFTGLRRMFPKSKMFSGYSIGWLMDNNNPHEVDAISGAFFFIRREIGEKLSWWDEDYFMYGEDLDFAFRVKKEGWKIVFLPNAKVLHYGGVSAGIRKHIRKKSTASKATRLRSARASTQAMRIFYEKHYKNKYPKFLTSTVLFGVSVLQQLRVLRIQLS